jgi:hypothetical protein
MGVPIEDLGVVPDDFHKMTKNDVLNNNVDLINHAAALLATMPVFKLKAEVIGAPAETAQINMTTENLSRVDVFVNNRPRLSLDVVDEAVTINVPGPFFGFNVIVLQGFNADKLVAVTSLNL